MSAFIDYVKIYCKAGKGGDGLVSWRREKYVDKGGPAGGDGGKGGDIVLEGDRNLNTLLHLKWTKFIKAEAGERGGKMCRTGKSGKDKILKVPLGTVVKNAETGEILGEILEDKQRLVIAKGGRGGLGNWHFRSSVKQAPDFAQQGKPGEEITVILELKLLADVGLVGFPNAGKSTLISVMSAAKPKIGDYPFTTLVPNLGTVFVSEFETFVIADIPGIIEGAHQGKGLGLRFLRHIERNSVLLFVIPADSDDIAKEYQTLLNELRQYNPELMNKPRSLVLSKSDLLDEELKEEIRKELAETLPEDIEYMFVSAVTGENIKELKRKLYNLVKEQKELYL